MRQNLSGARESEKCRGAVAHTLAGDLRGAVGVVDREQQRPVLAQRPQDVVTVGVFGVMLRENGFQRLVAGIAQHEVDLAVGQCTRGSGGVDVQPARAVVAGVFQRAWCGGHHRLRGRAGRVHAGDLGVAGEREQRASAVGTVARADLHARTGWVRTIHGWIGPGDVEQQVAVHAHPQHLVEAGGAGLRGEGVDGVTHRCVVHQIHTGLPPGCVVSGKPCHGPWSLRKCDITGDISGELDDERQPAMRTAANHPQCLLPGARRSVGSAVGCHGRCSHFGSAISPVISHFRCICVLP
ncbi:hypothetical protein MSMEI_1278 [Mycolicibacterium smegmatis MC2 155]|uniref:Uncharacterized protein n=1 Tax=Mycolicibacterium smegmatis (strain ATCC 700084 / mc(2)155) TaxID=246196 RepID=I7G595_MYCS2|nr:hypothetical protein MSMEI_1278 [Mycolicibacterium smegmatis MC2 155]